MRKIVIVALCLVLSACGENENITAVKNGYVDQDRTIKLGQVLDNRSLCATVQWSNSEDELGRNIVRYECQYVDPRPIIEQAKKDTSNSSVAMNLQLINEQKEELKAINQKIKKIDVYQINLADQINKNIQSYKSSDLIELRTIHYGLQDLKALPTIFNKELLSNYRQEINYAWARNLNAKEFSKLAIVYLEKLENVIRESVKDSSYLKGDSILEERDHLARMSHIDDIDAFTKGIVEAEEGMFPNYVSMKEVLLWVVRDDKTFKLLEGHSYGYYENGEEEITLYYNDHGNNEYGKYILDNMSDIEFIRSLNTLGI